MGRGPWAGGRRGGDIGEGSDGAEPWAKGPVHLSEGEAKALSEGQEALSLGPSPPSVALSTGPRTRLLPATWWP